MKANTAIGLLALGIATLLTTSRPSPTRRRAARLFASLAIVIGALTLGEYLLGRNLGLDRLIFRDVSAVPTVHPGRPALQTAITFILLGSALLLLLLQSETTTTRPVSALTGSSFVLALSAVICDTFGVPGLDGAPRITPIALLTAVGVAAAVRWDRRPRPGWRARRGTDERRSGQRGSETIATACARSAPGRRLAWAPRPTKRTVFRGAGCRATRTRHDHRFGTRGPVAHPAAEPTRTGTQTHGRQGRTPRSASRRGERSDHQRRSRRHHHDLEPRRREALWLPRRTDRRSACKRPQST